MKTCLIAVLASLFGNVLDSSGSRGSLDPGRFKVSGVRATDGEPVFAISVSRARISAAAGRRDGSVVVWDARTWEKARAFKAHEGYCYTAVFSPDGGELATAGIDGTVRLWNPETGALRRTIQPSVGAVVTLAFAEGGRRILAGGEGGVAILDVPEGKGLSVFRDPAPGVTAVAASGGLGAAAGTDGKVWIWDLAQGKVLHVLKSGVGCTHAVAFHPGGRWLASAGTDGKIRIWNPGNGEVVRALEGHAGTVRALTFASGGRHLVSGGEDGVRVWDFETGRSLRTLEMAGSSAFGLAVGPTGREVVATGGDSRIWEWGGRGVAAVPEAKPPRAGFLGITYGDSPGGALVRDVTKGSQAMQAGVKPGDVIVGMDGTPVEESDDLLRFMREAKEGDEVHMRIRRDGALRVLKVKLGRRPHEP